MDNGTKNKSKVLLRARVYALVEVFFNISPYYTYWLIRVSEISELNIHSIFRCLDTIGIRILFVTVPFYTCARAHMYAYTNTHRYYTRFNQLLIGMPNVPVRQSKIRKKKKSENEYIIIRVHFGMFVYFQNAQVKLFFNISDVSFEMKKK